MKLAREYSLLRKIVRIKNVRMLGSHILKKVIVSGSDILKIVGASHSDTGENVGVGIGIGYWNTLGAGQESVLLIWCWSVMQSIGVGVNRH